jgi:hypothetical protein
VSATKTASKQTNSHCQPKTAAEKVNTAKPGMILKTVFKKAESQLVHLKLQLKQMHCNLRYEMKSSN